MRGTAKQSIPVNYIAYDVTQDALVELERYLAESGYQKIAGEELHPLIEGLESSKGYIGPVYQKEGQTVTLVHGKITDSNEHTQQLLNSLAPQVTLCMFGVLSHIPGRINRQNTLKMFADITCGPVILSVPNVKSHAEKLARYDALRKEHGSIGLAQETGDIRYERDLPDGGQVSIFYHLYTPDEFMRDMIAAGLSDHIIGCANILPETDLTRTASPSAQIDDFRQSVSMPAEELERDALYLLAEAMPERTRELGLPDAYRLNSMEVHTPTPWGARVAETAVAGGGIDL